MYKVKKKRPFNLGEHPKTVHFVSTKAYNWLDHNNHTLKHNLAYNPQFIKIYSE